MQSSEVEASVARLLSKGVVIPSPSSVEIGPDVDPERISGEGVILHPGCRLHGAKTLILPGAELGSEAPVSICDCQLGRNVKLKGGFFAESCFLDGVVVDSCAQVREGCLLEEKARCAHTVGLKQTILFPFVTLGSLINFCDCLMAGGTDEKNHSEVGSSYIHFNYTPNQDKATASLVGDVPRGVMLNQPPIFLGGQGGLVGPARIAYGVVTAAGTIVRKDLLKENSILLGSPAPDRSLPFHRGLYGNLRRIIDLNFTYISSLLALRRWYLSVRAPFFGPHPMERALHEGAVRTLEKAVTERVKRLGEVADRMPRSIQLLRGISTSPSRQTAVTRKREFHERWNDIAGHFAASVSREGDPALQDEFLSGLEHGLRNHGKDYLTVIRALDPGHAEKGTAWLQSLVDELAKQAWAMLPGFQGGE